MIIRGVSRIADTGMGQYPAATTQIVPRPPATELGTLSRILILALSAVLMIALAGIIWTVVDGKDSTSPDVIVTVFSSALSGMLGLFVVRSPTS